MLLLLLLLLLFSASISNLVNISAFSILSYQNRWRDRFTAFQCCMIVYLRTVFVRCVYEHKLWSRSNKYTGVVWRFFSLSGQILSLTDSPFFYIYSAVFPSLTSFDVRRTAKCVCIQFFSLVWINHSILILVYTFYTWTNSEREKERDGIYFAKTAIIARFCISWVLHLLNCTNWQTENSLWLTFLFSIDIFTCHMPTPMKSWSCFHFMCICLSLRW